MIRKQFILKKKDILIYAGTALAISLFFVILFGVTATGLREEQVMDLVGTGITSLLIMLVHIIMGVNSFCMEFNLAVAMGQRRKNFTAGYFAIAVLELLAMLFVVLLVNVITGLFMGRTAFSYFWWLLLMLVLAVGAAIFEIFVASFFMRFGKKVIVIFWLLYMLFFVSSDRVVGCLDENEAARSLLEQLFRPQYLVGIVVVLLVGLTAAAWHYLKKQQVN